MGLERTIHMNLAEHPAGLEPALAGHSIGRWEDDVLIVDTIGFEPGVLSADAVTMHSDQLHVVERFTLDPQGRALRREYVAEDPLYFIGEYRGADTVLIADLPYEGYNCDDRSYVSDGDAAAARSTTAQPVAEADEDDTPWWMFWK
jgi:hypothetical protein